MYMAYRHVAKSLKALMHGVQGSEEIDEDEVEDMVCRLIPTVIRAYIFISSLKPRNSTRRNISRTEGNSRPRSAVCVLLHISRTFESFLGKSY